MFLAIHLLAAAMYAVLLTSLWLFLGLKFAIWNAHRRGGPEGWLADAERILHGDNESDVLDEPRDAERDLALVRARA